MKKENFLHGFVVVLFAFFLFGFELFLLSTIMFGFGFELLCIFAVVVIFFTIIGQICDLGIQEDRRDLRTEEGVKIEKKNRNIINFFLIIVGGLFPFSFLAVWIGYLTIVLAIIFLAIVILMLATSIRRKKNEKTDKESYRQITWKIILWLAFSLSLFMIIVRLGEETYCTIEFFSAVGIFIVSVYGLIMGRKWRVSK